MLAHQHPDATRGRLKTQQLTHLKLKLQPHVLYEPTQLLIESRSANWCSRVLSSRPS